MNTIKRWFTTPDPEVAHMSLGTHWVLRIVAIATIVALIYTNR